MVTSIHTLIYSTDAAATRAFFRDVLGWPFVTMEGDWLIFKTGPSELGVHPTAGEHGGEAFDYPLHHSVSIMCDDIEQTMADLKAKGAQFKGGVMEMGFGRGAMLVVPAAGDMLLYQPLHPKAYDL